MDAERQAGGEELHEQREWLRVTLSCVGDAVITTDADGGVTSINPAAQELTGWTQAEASGVPLEAVFRTLDQESHRPGLNPASRALREGVAVGLANHSVLVARDGTETVIEDSAAPIRSEAGEVAGVVLVFRDIRGRRLQEHLANEALRYAEEIVATLRETFLVLDRSLHVKTANDAFYRAFHVSEAETVGRFVYELGDGQWDIPDLRRLLGVHLPEKIAVRAFQVEHTFPDIAPPTTHHNPPSVPPG